MVCINGAKKEGSWNVSGIGIGVLGMVKYTAARSVSKYVLAEKDGRVW